MPDSWILETQAAAYVISLGTDGRPAHAYWGPHLPNRTDYPAPAAATPWAFSGPSNGIAQEYPTYSAFAYLDPCLKVTFADGVRDLDLTFAGATEQDGELILYLRDAVYPFAVELHYRAYVAQDVIARWAVLVNEGDAPILIERAWSAQWHVPHLDRYRLSALTGRWFEEFNLQRIWLQPGSVTHESRRLTTSHQANPWFAVDSGDATETHGSVWFGALAWSGNWQQVAEVTDLHAAQIMQGLNDWDFAWRLQQGERFTTPISYGGFATDGFGGASRRLHDLVRDAIVPHRGLVHPVLYNSWEATTFNVDVASQSALADRAAAIGVELFVMDDGWFKGRTLDNAGLGDWTPDPVKFPQGLGPLIARVHKLGMQFGLWIEPEMVNPDSDLYRAHPDWVIAFPTRPRSESRQQLILNMARTDVQGYLIDLLDQLLTENAIAFIKWDMNRNVTEPGWADAPRDAREIWVRYVDGLYHVWGTLRQRHPDVIWQSCSGGGGRADLGILRLADQIWISDNTEATARLRIQEGFAQVFPASTMEAWVTDAHADMLSLEFRFHVSMCGALGIGANIVHWNEDEMATATRLVALYKEIRPLVQAGERFGLRSPLDSAYSAMQYMARDRSAGILFVFRTHLAEPAILPPLRLQGLKPTARYEIEGEAAARSGAAWMADGLMVPLGDFASAARRITQVE